MNRPLRAVIWLPTGPDMDRWEAHCLAWCERYRADVVAVMHVGEDAEWLWGQVRRMAWEGVFDYLVVAREDHLPRLRRPRIVVVANEPPPSSRHPDRRPRLLN